MKNNKDERKNYIYVSEDYLSNVLAFTTAMFIKANNLTIDKAINFAEDMSKIIGMASDILFVEFIEDAETKKLVTQLRDEMLSNRG